jgi:DNA-directed RNA polymerase specialized sigma24 family protein
MMQTIERRPENPAKTYLKRYRALVIQRDSLQRSIDAAYDRACSRTVRLKPVHVTGGGGVYDRMAEDVARISDETEQLKAAKERAENALSQIMEAIQAVPDEMQRTVLLLRYVEGLDWIKIQEEMQYERTQVFVIHGRALWNVKKWMEAGK